jgi:SAM-dependent MidA family methyltransferase
MDPGNPDLVRFIHEAVRRDGPMRFDRFMEQALYHAELGYYGSGRCRIGRRGDYFTNVSVGPLFGRMLAAQFAEMWNILGRPEDFSIVEQGAHSGEFARDVLETLREQEPDFFSTLRYSFVEPFPVLEAQQKEVLRDFSERLMWRKSLDELPAFSGVHFSNELLDSMPVRLITRDGDGGWEEKFVAEAKEGFQFVTQPITDEKLRERLANLPSADGGNYETEINLAALDWVEGVASRLQRGFVLAVDYGFSRPHFFAAERKSGTLQGYAGHRPVSSPLHQIGHADIASHVEWTSVAERAEQCGLTVVGFTDQHHFMTGMLSVVEPAEEQRRGLQTLMHPEYLGTRFQYLALGKDVPPAALTGFRFARDARKELRIKTGP